MGEGTVTLTITQQYRNMKEIIDTCPWLISLAEEACHSCGVTPLILPIRGGTDGAQLSFMGLPCPNLGTGGHAYHGPYEHITAEGMDAAVDVTLEIIRLFSQKKSKGNPFFKSPHFQRPDIIKNTHRSSGWKSAGTNL